MTSCKNVEAKKIYKKWFDELPIDTEFTATDVWDMLKDKMKAKLPATKTSITYIIKWYGHVEIDNKRNLNSYGHPQNYNVYKKVEENEG